MFGNRALRDGEKWTAWLKLLTDDFFEYQRYGDSIVEINDLI